MRVRVRVRVRVWVIGKIRQPNNKEKTTEPIPKVIHT